MSTKTYIFCLSLSLSSHIHLYDFSKIYTKDGEQVEFEVITEPNGRSKAFNVTGPGGSYVQGAPKRFNNDFGHDDRF